MRVVCLLDEVLKESPVPSAALEARLGLDSRTIKKLRQNARDWRLDADAFTKLMLFGFEHGLANGIFAIRPHVIWRTFTQSADEASRSAALYRASRVSDAKVEAELTSFLQRIGCGSVTEIIDPPKVPDIDEIRDAMRTKNCVFVGSPKSNAASELALCLLWDTKPFQPRRSGQDKLPFHILMPDAEEHRASSIIVPGGQRHGFAIPDARGPGLKLIRVAWKPLREYETSISEGQDAAMVVVARSPLGTAKEVTTIVIVGYTGLATHVTATQLMLGEPPVSEDAMASAGTHLLAYTFQYRKPRRSAGSRAGDLRREIPDTGRWAPPWGAVTES